MKSTLAIIALVALTTLTACDNKPKATIATDDEKEERLYMACLDALKVRVKAGEDNLEDAITSCRVNASNLSTKVIYHHETRKGS